MNLLPALRAALILILAAMPSGTKAQDYTAGDLRIFHPHLPQPAAKALSAAGYFAITNTGLHDDRLIGIETPAASASLHLSQVDDNGVATMMALDGLDIAVGTTVTLAPGGLHVMMTGLAGPLTHGDMVPATMIFAIAGRVDIAFMVEEPAGGGHSAMDHGAKTP